MKIKSITRGQAQEAMKNWIDNYPNLPSVDEEFSELRKEIQEINNTVRKETNDDSDLKKSLYQVAYATASVTLRLNLSVFTKRLYF